MNRVCTVSERCFGGRGCVAVLFTTYLGDVRHPFSVSKSNNSSTHRIVHQREIIHLIVVRSALQHPVA